MLDCDRECDFGRYALLNVRCCSGFVGVAEREGEAVLVLEDPKARDVVEEPARKRLGSEGGEVIA